MSIPMDPNSRPCRRSVQPACSPPNQNGREPVESQGRTSEREVRRATRPIRFFSIQPRANEQQFERHDEVQLNDEELRQMAMRTHETSTNHPAAAAAAAAAANKSNVNPQIPPAPSTAAAASTTSKLDSRTDGTLSDSVLSTQTDTGKKRRPSMSSKALVILGLSKKTNSASNLGHGNNSCPPPQRLRSSSF